MAGKGRPPAECLTLPSLASQPLTEQVVSSLRNYFTATAHRSGWQLLLAVEEAAFKHFGLRRPQLHQSRFYPSFKQFKNKNLNLHYI